MHKVDEVYDKLEDRRKKAVVVKLVWTRSSSLMLGATKKQGEEVNSGAEVAIRYKDNHQVMEDTRREDHLEKECEREP